MIPIPSPPPPPLSPIATRMIDKGYSCVVIKDKDATTCIYTAQPALPPTAPHHATDQE